MTLFHSGQNPPITLTAQEMLEISQEISRDFTPRFSSPMPEPVSKIRLSPQELLDIGRQISRDFAPKISADISEVTLLPVDPGHLHAYWHLAEDPETTALVESDGEHLTLRIYSQPDEQQTTGTDAAAWFDIVIDTPNTRQQVTLPEHSDKSAYSAAIGRYGADDDFIVLARSNIVHAPAAHAAWRQNPDSSFGSNASGQGIGN